jgi:hypothetical protein
VMPAARPPRRALPPQSSPPATAETTARLLTRRHAWLSPKRAPQFRQFDTHSQCHETYLTLCLLQPRSRTHPQRPERERGPQAAAAPRCAGDGRHGQPRQRGDPQGRAAGQG